METVLNQATKEIRQKLVEKLLSVNVKAVIYNGSKSNGYKPYTLCVNDNLKVNIEDTEYIKKGSSNRKKHVYGASDLTKMSAIASSAALTFNTFFRVSDEHRLFYDNNEYSSFKPEVSRSTLPQNHGGNAHIDAELTSKNKVLLIEMKMFEPFYFNPVNSINNKDGIKKEFKKYLYNLDEAYGDMDNKKDFQQLFQTFKHLILGNDEDETGIEIEHYDAIQMLKHTLSIVNNTNRLPTEERKEVELLSLTWYASETSMDLDEDTRAIVQNHDDIVKQEAERTVSIINKALKDMGHNHITLKHESYRNFIENAHFIKQQDVLKYLKARYL